MRTQNLIEFGMAAIAICPAIPVYADSLTSSMRSEDKRLEQSVSLVAPRIYIGDLLEKLAAQTGIDIAADEKDGAADTQIAVFLTNVPMGEALNSLWSLVSYKDALWHWERNGKTGAYQYRLTRTIGAKTFAARLQREIQTAFEKEASVMLAGANMSAEERERHVSELSDSMLQDDNKVAESLLDGDRVWTGLSILGETLSAEQQVKVLRGQGSVRVPVDRLSHRGRAFVHSEWVAAQATRKLPDGSVAAIPEPASVMFITSVSGEQLGPSLYIHMDGLGGYSYLGATPMHNGLKRLLAKRWMLPGDTAKDSSEALKVSAPQKEQPSGRSNHIQERRLGQLAESVPLCLLARLPADQDHDPGAPNGQTVGEFLKLLTGEPPYLVHKWRTSTLLLTYLGWFRDEASSVPWSVVKQLRGAEKAGGGFLAIDDLFSAANTLSVGQITRLADEFPVMAHVAYWRDLFAYCQRKRGASRSVRTDSGLALSNELVAILRENPYVKDVLDRETVTAVRITDEEHTDDPRVREATIGVVTKDKKWIPVMGFVYKCRSEATGPDANR